MFWVELCACEEEGDEESTNEESAPIENWPNALQWQQQQHLYSPSTHADADKVKKINNISVSTQLSLELK